MSPGNDSQYGTHTSPWEAGLPTVNALQDDTPVPAWARVTQLSTDAYAPYHASSGAEPVHGPASVRLAASPMGSKRRWMFALSIAGLSVVGTLAFFEFRDRMSEPLYPSLTPNRGWVSDDAGALAPRTTPADGAAAETTLAPDPVRPARTSRGELDTPTPQAPTPAAPPRILVSPIAEPVAGPANLRAGGATKSKAARVGAADLPAETLRGKQRGTVRTRNAADAGADSRTNGSEVAPPATAPPGPCTSTIEALGLCAAPRRPTKE
jgi:hypothetical protein